MFKKFLLASITLLLLVQVSCATSAPAVITPTIRPLLPSKTPRPTQAPVINTPSPEQTQYLPKNLPACIDPETLSIGTVTELVDGDTIYAEIDGTSQKIRYIGIDTPEMDQGGDLARQALDVNAALTAGQTVALYADVENTDMYERLLRYVFVGDTFVNEELVRQGLAEEQYYAPNGACLETFKFAQDEAMANGIGIWQMAEIDQSQGYPRIVSVDKKAEVVIIENAGAAALDLSGWLLVSERGNQQCVLGGVLNPGARLKIYAQTGKDGYNCDLSETIWNNSQEDPASLYDPSGALVDRSVQ